MSQATVDRREYMRRWRARNRERTREYHKKWREENRERLREMAAKSDAKHRPRRRAERLDEARWWLGGKCAECGDVESLEFDHIDPSTKEFCIAAQPMHAPRKLFAELEKCQLLCRECHKKKTRRERAAREHKERERVDV